jgi:hypothetical protein
MGYGWQLPGLMCKTNFKEVGSLTSTNYSSKNSGFEHTQKNTFAQSPIETK